MKILVSLLFTALLTLSCTSPEGTGIIGGEIYIMGCESTDNYGTPSFPAYFNMLANYFVGEPVLDEGPVPTKHRFDIRMQRGSNTLEDTDVLYIQIAKTSLTARLFSEGKPVPVGPQENVTSSLGLYLTCPSFYDGPDVYHTGNGCPDITLEEQLTMCENVDFGEHENLFEPASPFAEGHSCLILCEFGTAERGTTINDDFKIDFGDTVSGIYFFTLGNRRIIGGYTEICDDGIDNDFDGFIDEDNCETPTAGGFIQGNFHIKVIRAKAIQAFP
ncbi:hypothetical protein KKF34_04470 [Myxococcota bacterium]|nr:hypothetical protein [Myxococcota bacterium]MBU1379253.1 hypothetical protein [Myxococcota bacterium]MBU1496113.1 hypothetical protein [Myxococcota bacterium]